MIKNQGFNKPSPQTNKNSLCFKAKKICLNFSNFNSHIFIIFLFFFIKSSTITIYLIIINLIRYFDNNCNGIKGYS